MGPPRSLLVIENPAAGGPPVEGRRTRIEDRCSAAGIEVEWRTTAGPGRARDLSREHGPAFQAIAALGGDGTLNEVVDGILAAGVRGARIAILPAGTGNATARELGIATVDQAIGAVLDGTTRRIDVARVRLDGRLLHAVNVIGWGAFARINARAEKLRRVVGNARYTVAAAIELLRPRLAPVAGEMDGERQDHVLLGCACLTRFSGRGMMLAPDAAIDDGRLDLLTLHTAPRWTLAAILRRVFDGSHVRTPYVALRKTRAFTLRLDRPGDVVVDGERVHGSRLVVEVLPRAISVFAPARRGRDPARKSEPGGGR